MPARKAVETANAFAALTSEEPDVPDPLELVEDGKAAAALGRFVAEPSFPEPRVGLVKDFGASRKCCSFTSSQRRCSAGSETSHAETSQLPRPYRPKLGVMPFLEKRMLSFRPLATGWEKLQMIPDSGASVSVVPPSVRREYEVVRGEAAIVGLRCEIADGNEIPNLGDKLMPVMTREESWRGVNVEVADIARALQSVRSLAKTSHKVAFGDGIDVAEHYIENNATGEVNWVEDDGFNYLMTYFIAPRESAVFTGPAPSA